MFEGKLNPLSGRTVYETCVIPVLLYNSENWFVTNQLLQKLESFQCELGRRILKLSRHHSALAVRLALCWPSVASRLLIRKLLYLKKVLESPDSISHHFFTCLSKESPDSSPIQLVEGCRYLESHLHLCSMTERVLKSQISTQEIRKLIIKHDQNTLLTDSRTHISTSLASEVASKTSWLKIWDTFLDCGQKGTLAIQSFYRELTRPVFSSTPCKHCEIKTISTPYFEHFIQEHLKGQKRSSKDFTDVLSESSNLCQHLHLFSPFTVTVSD